jgi:hypothetical protein
MFRSVRIFILTSQFLLLVACGSDLKTSDSVADPASPNTTITTNPNTSTDNPNTTASNANTVDGTATTTNPPAVNFVLDDFSQGYDTNMHNALGALRTDGNTMASLTASTGGLMLTTPSTPQTPAFWFEGLDSAHFDISFYTAIDIDILIPVGGTMTATLVSSATDPTATLPASAHQIPYNQITGTRSVWHLPLSQFGAVDLSNIQGVRLDGFAANTNNVLYSINVTGLRGVTCQTAPSALTARLELPDPNWNTPSAAFTYDDYSFVSPTPLGPTAGRDSGDLATLASLVQPATGAFTGALGVSGRPYAVSGSTTAMGAGDRIKIRTVQSFSGLHTYTARLFVPLAQNSMGGEKWVAASFLFCESCTPDANNYKPEIDIECHYADLGSNPTLRSSLNATPTQFVCEMHIQDGSDDGFAATPLVVEGNAWHEIQFSLTDPASSGYYTIAMQLDDVAVQWPGATPGTTVTAVDTGASNWTSKSVVYPVTNAFNMLLSLEHLAWAASQLSTDYQTVYFDWVTVD